ncbi:hypothetical protein AX16_007600 [Volvariella volvacea WC 439]|nr:hypothetical protein AX16_007600 [Volvariella volvacea WC 439]
MSSNQTAPPPAQSKLPPHLLIAEALGFAPQLLLDDIINIANNAVHDGVNGMEDFLQEWANARAERVKDDWDSVQEVEQGLVAFQTLLDHHTDLAFDLFEAWALRNIFAVPEDLPIVLPHHKGLDLSSTAEKEQELMDELEDLRRQINNQRRFKRAATRALRISKAKQKRAEERLEYLSMIDHPALEVLPTVLHQYRDMWETLSTLPTFDATTVAALSQLRMTDPGKRLWETNKTGYFNWAVEQLMTKSRGLKGDVDAVSAQVKAIGSSSMLRRAEGSEG